MKTLLFILSTVVLANQAFATTTIVDREAMQRALVLDILQDVDNRSNYQGDVDSALFTISLLQQPKTQDATKTALSDEELAKKLANPVAAMISVPFQGNYDRKIGPNNDGTRFQLNFQPVIPFELNDEWNLISRTIVPIIKQKDILPGSGIQTGVGDIVQSFFLSPRKPTEDGWILGVGPVLLLPTASNDLLGTEKWGAGPTFVGLKQDGPWTYGMLANHTWSYAGNKNRADINATFIQPFASYTTHDAWTFGIQTETTYSWETEEWSIPIEGVVSKMTSIGNQKLNIFGGLKYWVDSPDSGPQGLGFRFGITLLFPN
ncbi:MAG: hypothetical protein QGI78_00865 [Phycisphaerales bacterium]|nr:hypothetical protein [Phycisphaerales bacterium]